MYFMVYFLMHSPFWCSNMEHPATCRWYLSCTFSCWPLYMQYGDWRFFTRNWLPFFKKDFTKMFKFKVFTLVCLFVIRLRFPPRKSVANIIRERYGDATLKDIRRLEKFDFKKRKIQLDINFLETCKCDAPNYCENMSH